MAIAATGAIFLDRDGVINVNRSDHVKSWDEFEFIPGALETLRRLSMLNMPIFIVTNQAIVNRKIVTAAVIEDIHQQMVEKITQAGGQITKVYYCPHDSHEQCECRKPAPGMLKKAALEFGIDLTRSFIVGDAWTDVQAGLAVDAQSILVMTGRGKQYFHNCLSQYVLRVGAACDLTDAADIITSALQGTHVDTTPRLRRSFHMALRPEELIVL